MNQIIVLWCHPRSMSTAVERVMRERGDLACMHELFMYDYYLARRVRSMPHFTPEPGHPRDYSAIRQHIMNAARSGPVFLKDMAYYVLPRIFSDREFAARLTHAFLIREPRAAIASYWKLDPALTRDEVGLEAQRRLRDWLCAELGVAPPVLRAERVQADPQAAIGRFWSALGLAPAPHAFEWSGDGVGDWGQVEGWHGRVASSRRIEAQKPYDGAFERACNQAPHLAEFLAFHKPHYDALSEAALI